MPDPTVSMYLIASGTIFGAIAVTMYFVKWWPRYKLAFSLPGPKPVPIFGNALMFFQEDQAVPEIVNTIFHSYSSPSRLWLGPLVEFLITDADQMKAIFLSDKMVEKPHSYSLLRTLCGSGLVTAPAEKWISYRKLIAPTLNTIRVQSFLPILCKQAKLLVERMEKKVDGPEFDLLHQFSMCTFGTISEAAFGVEQYSAYQSLTEYDRAFDIIGALQKKRMLFWFLPHSIFYLTPIGKELKRNIDFCRNFALNIVKQKRREYRGQTNGLHESVNHNDNTAKKKAVLDLLLQMTKDGCELSNDELVDQVVTMILAGYETNATTLSFALLLLASYPDVQEKVYQELREIYKNDLQRDVTYEDTQSMDYMERVIRETMRLFPPAYMVGRQAIADVKIGAKYAIVAIKVTLATIIRKYVVKKDVIPTIEDIKLAPHILLRPVERITVRIERRL